MDEQEYVDLADRIRLTSVLAILKSIVPSNSSIIPTYEFHEIISTLYDWELQLDKLAKMESFDPPVDFKIIRLTTTKKLDEK